MANLVIVEVKGDINKALKEFKRKVIKSGHIFELRANKEYTKPTTQRREEKQKAIRKQEYNTILDKIAAGKLPPSAISRGKKTKGPKVTSSGE